MKASRRNLRNAAAKAEKRANYVPPGSRVLETSLDKDDYRARLAEHFKGDA